LEDLGKVQVTSASRKAEKNSSAPAAIYLLTSDMTREGGFTTLPDALRMVPGLYVAQTDARIWQISTRGFSDLYNNKMLVLVDGRRSTRHFTAASTGMPLISRLRTSTASKSSAAPAVLCGERTP